MKRKVVPRKYWTYPKCNNHVLTSCCPDCEESPFHPRDMTFSGFLRQVAQALTNIDGPFLRSLSSLVKKPGALTLAYCFVLLPITLLST